MSQISGVEQQMVEGKGIPTPADPAAMMADLAPQLESMANEAPDPMWVEALTRAQLGEFINDAPPQTTFGSDVHCHGAGVVAEGVGNVRTYQLITTTGARSPEQHQNRTGNWPYARANLDDGSQTRTMTVQTGDTTHRQGLGRGGGWNGWDDTMNLIVAALASFRHNFEALLLAYGERPSVPTTTAWKLPNLVLSPTIARRENRWNASIDVPEQFAPSASYSYSLLAPVPAVQFRVKVKSPTDSRGYVQFLDTNKQEVTVTDELEFSEGTTDTLVSVTGNPFSLRSGYVNINPSYAPGGITVKEITSIPPSIS